MTVRHRWTLVEEARLRELYPTTSAADCAAILGLATNQVQTKASKLGLRKPREWIAERARERSARPDHGGRAHLFKPGQTTWNKGVPGSTGLHPHTAAHHFPAGHRPHTWRPIGSYRVNGDGYLQRKLTDTGYPPRDWVSVHLLVWTAAYGPVPDGHAVAFLPGRKTTDPERITLDALECVSRAELMRRNTLHRYPKEIASLIQLRGVLNRQINKRERKTA